MNLIKRLKNLWELSEYRIGDPEKMKILGGMVKAFPTIKSRLAIIIPDDKVERFGKQNEEESPI